MGENQECERNPWADWPPEVLVTFGRGGCLWWSLGQGTMTRRSGWLRIGWRAGADKLGKVYRKVEVLVTDVVSSFWSWYLDSFFFFKVKTNVSSLISVELLGLIERTFYSQTSQRKWTETTELSAYTMDDLFIPESYIIQRVITISIIILSLCSSMAPMDILTLLWNLCKVCIRDFPTLM